MTYTKLHFVQYILYYICTVFVLYSIVLCCIVLCCSVLCIYSVFIVYAKFWNICNVGYGGNSIMLCSLPPSQTMINLGVFLHLFLL